MKNLLSIVVLFSLLHEGELGRFRSSPSAIDTECENVLLNNVGWGCEDLMSRNSTDPKPVIIPRGKICDGVVDCPNGRDEQCTEDTNVYQCKWILHTFRVCNGHDNCLNKEDERYCFGNKFSCDNGSVSLTFTHICDRMTDCADGSDETMFECHNPTMYNNPHIKCDTAIFPRGICRHHPLCEDRSDQNCVHELCGFMNCDQLTWFDYTTTKCHCACRDGYNMDENSTCTEIDCGPPPPLSNGNISFTNGTKYGSIATYMCTFEHELLGVSQRRCGRNGMWTRMEPSCVASTATCKRPIDIQNGNIFVTPGGGLKKGTSEQQQAVYQCDVGYTLIGNSTRDCNDGRWEGLAPQCIKKVTRCEVPSLDIDNGSITSPCQPGEGALEGTVLQYSCDPGYTLDGPRNVTCGKDGMWSSALPSCELCSLDIIFAIDDSSSISGKQFRGLKTFLANVVDSLDVGEDAVRIGVIKYAKGVKDEIRLDDFFGKEMLKAAVLKIKHERGGTRTGRAITRMVKAFQGEFGARVGASKIGIVITDGKSKDSVTRPVKRAERAGITLYAIGVGGSVDRPEIRTIAGGRRRAFFSTSFSTLNRIIKELTTGFGC